MKFEKYVLKNGLTLIFHKDEKTPLVTLNLIYNVGSKDEDEQKTGYAHLLEHLMFEGSVNIKDFDTTIEKAGGSNNAFTNNDYTNYYLTLPKDNIETALWLESDRMLNLLFDKKRFSTQKKVVIEEFRQTSLNEPYGDDIAFLVDLVYQKHPYKWTTIGKEISHIENAKREDLIDFYKRFYVPNNAILAIGGNFEFEEIKNLVEKWFSDIPEKPIPKRNLPLEPIQTARRENSVKKNVPFDVLYMAFPMEARTSHEFYVMDIITDILDDGKSSRFHQHLVKNNHFFEELDAFVNGNIENGLVIISGRPANGYNLIDAEKFIWEELENLKNNYVEDNELQKSINSLEFGLGYLKTNIMSKTRALSYYELLGDVNLVNNEKDIYTNITKKDVMECAKKVFDKNKVSVLHYLDEKKINLQNKSKKKSSINK